MKTINETKQNLINVTRQMIDKDGIDSVSMRDIGKEIKLSRSAVYRHFKNKEDLLASVVVENFEILKNHILTLTKRIYEPQKLVYEVLYTYYDFAIKNREHYQLMFGRKWNKEQFPNLYAAAFEIFEIVEKCLGKVLEQECSIRKPIKELTAMVYAFIHGLVELNFSGHSESEKGLDDSISLINSFLELICS